MNGRMNGAKEQKETGPSLSGEALVHFFVGRQLYFLPSTPLMSVCDDNSLALPKTSKRNDVGVTCSVLGASFAAGKIFGRRM